MTQAAYPLQIDRILRAPRGAVWRCWSEPELLMQWFCPLPWRVAQAQMELHPGGRFFVLMQGPQGEQVPSPGVYLQVETGRRIEAMGGELEIVARFPDGAVKISNFSDLGASARR